MPQATGLVAELETKFSDRVNVSLIEGDNGVFEVVADGELIFSKKELKRFPAYREIPKIVDELLPLPPPRPLK